MALATGAGVVVTGTAEDVVVAGARAGTDTAGAGVPGHTWAATSGLSFPERHRAAVFVWAWSGRKMPRVRYSLPSWSGLGNQN